MKLVGNIGLAAQSLELLILALVFTQVSITRFRCDATKDATLLDESAPHCGTRDTLMLRLLVQLALAILVRQSRVDIILRLGGH